MSAGAEPSAVEWLRRLSARELSARELAERCLERVEAAGRRLNALAAVDPDLVVAEAEAADAARARGGRQPLLGLPLTVKETLAVAGRPWESGSFARAGVVADRDATVVARLRAAGAIVLAQSSSPEYAWSYDTESALRGRTLNPFDPTRSAGGSSGGEGALLGADASPAGIGSDTGGSIRVPCHYNGIVGMRPSVRLVPETGSWPTTRDSGALDMTCVGPMGRYVEDVALLLATIAGPDGVDPFVSAAPATDPGRLDPAGFRVGFYVRDGLSAPSAETGAAVRDAAGALAAAGALVEEVEPPPLGEVTDLYFDLVAADGGARARADLAGAGGRHSAELAGLLESLAPRARSAGDFFELLARQAAFRARLHAFVAGFDAVIAPVAPGPAPPHGAQPGDEQPRSGYQAWVNLMAYSLGGLPVVVVPAGRERGLPLGVQVVAGAGRDAAALAAAAVVERELGGYAGLTHPLLPGAVAA